MVEKALVPAADNLPAEEVMDEAQLRRFIEENKQVGRENLTRQDMILPFWRLLQNNAGPEAGKFKSNTGEVRDQLDVTVTTIQPTRVLWEEEYTGEAGAPICKSGDGRTALVNGETHACTHEGCPFPHYKFPDLKACDWPNQYGYKDSEEPPSCKYGYVQVCIDNITEEPILITAYGTSVTPVKQFISRTGFQNKAFWEFPITLSSKFRQEAKLSWYEQTFTMQTEHDLKKKVRLLNMAKGIMAMGILNDSFDAATQAAAAAEVAMQPEVIQGTPAGTAPAQSVAGAAPKKKEPF